MRPGEWAWTRGFWIALRERHEVAISRNRDLEEIWTALAAAGASLVD